MNRSNSLMRLALPAFALSLGVGAVGCDDTVDVQVLEARLEIDPPVVDFGNVQVGTEASIVVLLRNTGDALLNLEGVNRGPQFDDAYTFDLNRTAIQPSGVAQLTLNFAPEDLGEKLATLIVKSNDPNVP